MQRTKLYAIHFNKHGKLASWWPIWLLLSARAVLSRHIKVCVYMPLGPNLDLYSVFTNILRAKDMKIWKYRGKWVLILEISRHTPTAWYFMGMGRSRRPALLPACDFGPSGTKILLAPHVGSEAKYS